MNTGTTDTAPAIPHAPDIEKNVLSLAMVAHDTAMAKLQAAGVGADSFYTPAYRIIWDILSRYHEAGRAVDIMIVAQELKDRGELASVGEMAGLADILASGGGAVYMLESYAATLKEKERARRRVLEIEKLYRAAKSGTLSADELDAKLTAAQESIIADGDTERGRVYSLKEIMIDVMDSLKKQIEAGTHIEGTRTGFPELDEMIGGMRAGGGFYLLAARPGEGKTAMALNIALRVATQSDTAGGGRVLFFSAEMSRKPLGERLLCSQAGLSKREMCKNGLNRETMAQILKATKRLSECNLAIIDPSESDEPWKSAEQYAAAIKRAIKKDPCALVIVDYAQLFNSDKAGNGNRVEDLEQVSGTFRTLAKTLPCPLLLLAQINRTADKAADKRPSMADIKGSGAFEQDAEAIFLLHRPEAHTTDEAARKEAQGKAELIICKNRNGETGIVNLEWDGSTQTFTPAPDNNE